MDKRIFKYFISSLFSLLLAASIGAQNTVPTHPKYRFKRDLEKENLLKKKEKKSKYIYPKYSGTYIGLDLWGIGSKILGADNVNSELDIKVGLYNRFFPTLEAGYGYVKQESNNNVIYKGSAPYFRIGADYNVMYNKKFRHQFLVGIRYGFAPVTFDIDAPNLKDKVYGGYPVEGERISFHSLKSMVGWAEFCAGFQTNIWKDTYMGWKIRFKLLAKASENEYGIPTYVPGLGGLDNSIGITYTITYKLPF